MSKAITNLERKRRRGLRKARAVGPSGGSAANYMQVYTMNPATSSFSRMLEKTVFFGRRDAANSLSAAGPQIKWLEDESLPGLTTSA